MSEPLGAPQFTRTIESNLTRETRKVIEAIAHHDVKQAPYKPESYAALPNSLTVVLERITVNDREPGPWGLKEWYVLGYSLRKDGSVGTRQLRWGPLHFHSDDPVTKRVIEIVYEVSCGTD